MKKVAKSKSRSGTRSRGRPPGTGGGLTRERILKSAERELDRRGLKGFSMRGVARSLKADPMAVYHYFAGRDALLTELGLRRFGEFPSSGKKSRSWRAGLLSLARAYLEHMRDNLELLIFLTQTPEAAAEPARMMSEHFKRVAEPLKLKPTQTVLAAAVFFDFLHGYALGLRGGAGTGAAFKKELDVVLDGIEGLKT